MKTKLTKALAGGIAGTAVMTMVMFMAPMMGLPKMNVAEMLSGMMGVPLAIGWIMHFMIGAMFAVIYALLLMEKLSEIKSSLAQGVVFGMIVFVFAQLVMAMMGKCILCMPDGRMGMLMGSIMGHVLYGIVVALIVNRKISNA